MIIDYIEGSMWDVRRIQNFLDGTQNISLKVEEIWDDQGKDGDQLQ